MAEEKLSKHGYSLYDEQKQMINPMFETLQRKGVVFVGQGPTGMGKTLVIGAVTKALVAQGKRVCIAVPTYTHLKEVMGYHLNLLGIEYAILRGLSALEPHEGCPLKGGEIPTPIFCSEHKTALTGPDTETCRNILCTVRKEKLVAEKAKVVLAVYHKLLSRPRLLNDFDIVIFDESHGLEPAVRHSRIPRIRREDLEVTASFLPEYKETLNEVAVSLERLAGRVDVPLAYVERRIIDPIRAILFDIEKRIHEIEVEKKRVGQEVVNAFYTLQSAIRAMERPGSYRFIHHEGSILAIPHEISFFTDRPKERSKDISIALISATIESPKFHAKDSGFAYHTLAPPVQIQSPRLIKKFRNRPILGLMDGPILRKDPRAMDYYKVARLEANKVIGEIVPSFDEPVLILCRSKDDARSIQKYLSTIKEVQPRLYIFDEEWPAADIDLVQSMLNREIESGRNIILTSASSRLWEGINIKRLRLLVVDALPYATPQPYERYDPESWSSWRTSRPFRFMIRRIQQGIGRLMRTKEDPWGVVVVIDGRFNAQWGTIKTALPVYMTDREIVRFVPKHSLKKEVEDTLLRLRRTEKSLGS